MTSPDSAARRTTITVAATPDESGFDTRTTSGPAPRAAAPAYSTPPLYRRLLRGQSVGAWLAEMVRFCAVGGMAYVVDVGLFNLLRFGPGELLGERPLTAKVISVAVSVLVAWLGNRHWTFARTRRADRRRELALFVAVNGGGMVIAVGCLAVSHYLLGFTSPLADNIAANGVGLVLGTAFRYLCYRYLVFTAPSRH